MSAILSSVSDYYERRLERYGATPAGVDWSSEESQRLRFAKLIELIDWTAVPSLIDYGCGYGALAQQLGASDWDFSYTGFDVAESMIEQARTLLHNDPRCRFTAEAGALSRAGYVVASGVFNVKLEAANTDWHDYVVEVLDSLASLSERGFAFNMLTRYADPPLMRDDLYYADPGRYFRHCKERYSRNVSLLHDYDLYEFTIHVRLGEQPKPLAD